MDFGENPQYKNPRKSIQSEPICPTGTKRRAGQTDIYNKADSRLS
jgi:hypothetical protein